MKLLGRLMVAFLLLPPLEAGAAEHGRVKWKGSTQAEADRRAAELAMTDSILRNGDIVVTDRGFLLFRGFLADGETGDFVPVPNPMSNPREMISGGQPTAGLKSEKGKPAPMGAR
jgi:hypothetical protein